MVSIEVFQTVFYLIGAIPNNLAKFSTSYLESLGLPTHTVTLWWGVGEGLWGGEEMNSTEVQSGPPQIGHKQEVRKSIKGKGKYFQDPGERPGVQKPKYCISVE